jgi:hypothetical protein
MDDGIDLALVGYAAMLSFFLGTALAKLLYSYDMDKARSIIAKQSIENDLLRALVTAKEKTNAGTSAD